MRRPRPPLASCVERLADLLGQHRPLDQLDLAVDRGEVGEVVGDVRALRAAGEQQAGEAHRVDHIVGAGLLREQLVVGGADHHADRHLGREVLDGEHDQDRGVVAPGRDQHGAGLVDPHRHQVLVARRVGLDHVAADFLGARRARSGSVSMTTMQCGSVPRAISSATASEPEMP